jgi:hypothetical protein
LEGETSDEACEIELKWGISANLIQNASVQAKTTYNSILSLILF